MTGHDGEFSDERELAEPPRTVRIEGSSLAEPARLDVIVARLVEAVPSRSFAAKLVERGFARVDGKAVKPSHKVEPRHVVEVDLSFLDAADAPPEAEAIPLAILHEDSHILVVDKPVGLVVHPGAGVSGGTLVNAVLAHCGPTLPSLGGPARAGIVHRLDRDTSGVMVVAKTPLALAELSRQFASHAQERRYLALCYGVPDPSSGDLETWHGRDPANRLRFAVVPEERGKRARLSYETLEPLAHGTAALVECRLHTGRTHQIRVQLTHVGHPLLGDALYGRPHGSLANHKALWARLSRALSRQMLHAAVLGLTHPATGEPLVFRSEPPADFAGVLALLRSPPAG